MYVVFEDIMKATGPKAHRDTCGHYQRWLKEGSDTTKWHGPYDTRDEAWEVCQKIAQKADMQPAEAVCCM